MMGTEAMKEAAKKEDTRWIVLAINYKQGTQRVLTIEKDKGNAYAKADEWDHAVDGKVMVLEAEMIAPVEPVYYSVASALGGIVERGVMAMEPDLPTARVELEPKRFYGYGWSIEEADSAAIGCCDGWYQGYEEGYHDGSEGTRSDADI